MTQEEVDSHRGCQTGNVVKSQVVTGPQSDCSRCEVKLYECSEVVDIEMNKTYTYIRISFSIPSSITRKLRLRHFFLSLQLCTLFRLARSRITAAASQEEQLIKPCIEISPVPISKHSCLTHTVLTVFQHHIWITFERYTAPSFYHGR